MSGLLVKDGTPLLVSYVTEGGGTPKEPVLLWENPNPSAAFSGQTVELDLSEYESALVVFNQSTAKQRITSRLYVKKDDQTELLGTGISDTLSKTAFGRNISAISNSGITFTDGVYGGSVNNTANIPAKIYGVKSTIVVEKTELEDAPQLLWTNPNPSTAFATQTISLDLSDYEGVIINFNAYTTNQTLAARAYVKKGESGIGGGHVSSSGSGRSRNIEVKENGVTISNTKIDGSTDNSALIPVNIYGVKHAVVEVESDAPELLWVNANPNSTFAAQTISLDLSEFEAVEIEYNFNDVGVITNHVIGKKNENSVTLGITDYSTYKSYNFRKCNISDTGVTFEGGLYTMNNNPSSVLSTNDSIIPTKIYGVKGVVVESISGAKQIEYQSSKSSFTITDKTATKYLITLMVSSSSTIERTIDNVTNGTFENLGWINKVYSNNNCGNAIVTKDSIDSECVVTLKSNCDCIGIIALN